MTTRTVSTSSVLVSQRIVVGLVCLFVGSFLVFGAGLAQSETLHNAAHDTRHAIGFPCH
jgi:cobalt transporter subunit CbtB